MLKRFAFLSPGKDPGEKVAGEKAAMRRAESRAPAGTLRPALTRMNCDVDVDLPAAGPRQPPRVSDWILSALVLGEAALIAYGKLRSRFTRLRA